MKLKKSLSCFLPIFKNSKLSIWKHITLLNHPKLDRLKISKILEKNIIYLLIGLTIHLFIYNQYINQNI